MLSVDEPLLSVLGELSVVPDELAEPVELLEDVLDELEDELSEDVDELSETLSEPLISSREVTFPAQPVHSSIADKTNAADLINHFFIIRSFN